MNTLFYSNLETSISKIEFSKITESNSAVVLSCAFYEDFVFNFADLGTLGAKSDQFHKRMIC